MRVSAGEQSGVLAALRRFWQRSYAADYVGFGLLLTAYVFIQTLEPFHRMFSLDDHSKQYPHALVQRVSSWQNILYAGIAPLTILILWAVVIRPGFHKAHVTIFGLFISLFLTSLLTDLIKNAVGRPRPDLIARCKPQPGTPEHALVTIAVCTETNYSMLQDGWRSFPSGHSSWAFAGLGYFALFLAGQFHIFRPRTDLARVLVTLTPLVGAGMIAMSRLADYRHDVFDVTTGSILGMSTAWFSYRRYYRPLKHPRCDEPYSGPWEHGNLRPVDKTKDVEMQADDGFSIDDLSEDEAQAYPLTEPQPERAPAQLSGHIIGQSP